MCKILVYMRLLKATLHFTFPNEMGDGEMVKLKKVPRVKKNGFVLFSVSFSAVQCYSPELHA